MIDCVKCFRVVNQEASDVSTWFKLLCDDVDQRTPFAEPHLWLPKDFCRFWQRVSIACYAERCLSYDRFCLTVRLSDRPSVRPSIRPSVTVQYHAKMTPATIMRSPLEDSPMTLVSWRLTSPRNSKGNIGSEGAKWARGSKNVTKIGNF